jgi:hypothetical protein
MVTIKSPIQHQVLTQAFASNLPILVLMENVFTSVATAHDMIKGTRILHASFPDHGKITAFLAMCRQLLMLNGAMRPLYKRVRCASPSVFSLSNKIIAGGGFFCGSCKDPTKP